MTTRDVKEDADGEECDNEARAAVRDEGQRNPGQRRESEHGSQIDRRLAADERRDPGCEPDGGNEPRAGTAGHACDAERIEGVAAFRNEPRLDAIRRPGERHFHPACAQRFRYCERRGDVTDRSAGCDQAPELLLLCHGHGRC